jgi:lipopolysaccharide transport system ATP-binding protein
MSNVITVKNLGKKYTISHQQREEYSSLRDVITNGVRTLSKKIVSPFTSHPSSLSVSEDFWALKDVSFEVKQGDRVGIIGRNGAGKSTLLKILSRITEPSTGSIRIKGRVASLLEVGTGFHPELTGRENIFLNGAILGMQREEIRQKFDEIVDFAEIEKFLDTPVKRYSSGMYVRLAFAVAAHLEPEILIVDEVLAVGDTTFQAKCISKMKQVSSQGQTVLFVSHNMGVIGSFCNRGLLLSAGQIGVQGEIGEILRKYLNNFQKVAVSESELTKKFDWLTGKHLVFERIKLSSMGHQIEAVEMGGPLRVDIDYLFKGHSSFLKIGIQIIDSSGSMIAVLSPNQQCPDFVTRMKSSGTISCSIAALNLIPGYYNINLQVEIPGIEPLYSIDGAASFLVLEKDVYQTGVIPSKIHGITYFPAGWSF